MSYTRPAGNAANLSFQPARNYQRPAGNDADLSFETGVLRAKHILPGALGVPFAPRIPSPIVSTRFGTPVLRLTSLATGFNSTGVGAPRLTTRCVATAIGPITAFGTPTVPWTAKGFSSTRPGTPNSPYLQVGAASAIASTQVGLPHFLTLWAYQFSGIPSTVVPMAYYAFAQTLTATGAVATQFGTPIRFGVGQSTETIHRADGGCTTEFGTPSTPVNFAGAVQSFGPTLFGVPRTTLFGAVGFGTTTFGAQTAVEAHARAVFGTPAARLTQAASGWLSGEWGMPTDIPRPVTIHGTLVGVPSATKKYPSIGVSYTRFGRPAGLIGGHVAYGFAVGRRFGVPQITVLLNPRTATGMDETRVGTPTAQDIHHAFSLPPVSVFSAPVVLRNPIC